MTTGTLTFENLSRAAQVWLLTSLSLDQPHERKQLHEAFEKTFSNTHGFRQVFIEHLFILLETGRSRIFLFNPTTQTLEEILDLPRLVLVRLPTPSLQNDKEVTILRQLHLMGCRMINPIQGILRCVNKAWHLQDLAAAGVPIAPTLTYSNASMSSALTALSQVSSAVPMPCVVKNVRGNRGQAVFLAPSLDTLEDIQHLLVHDAPYMFQNFIENSKGRDVRVIVVGRKIIGAMCRQASGTRIQSNIKQGGSAFSVPITPEIETICMRVVEVLGLDIAGIDLLFTPDGGYCVCEVNNNVGFTAFDRTLNVSVAEHIASYFEDIIAATTASSPSCAASSPLSFDMEDLSPAPLSPAQEEKRSTSVFNPSLSIAAPVPVVRTA